jgi:hypothetical protein
MMYRDEDELKNALQISSWKNLSKDKLVAFVSMMPDMDRELARKIIEQFPEFRRFAEGALDVLAKRYDSALDHNRQSQDTFYQGTRELRSILAGELDKDYLTRDEREFIIEKLMELSRMDAQKDSENKRFLDSMFGKVTVAAGVVVAAGAVILGGKVAIQRGDSDES